MNDIMKLFGSGERVRVLNALINNDMIPMTINRIAIECRVSRSTVVRHLRMLQQMGILVKTNTRPAKYRLDKKQKIVRALIKLAEVLAFEMRV